MRCASRSISTIASRTIGISSSPRGPVDAEQLAARVGHEFAHVTEHLSRELAVHGAADELVGPVLAVAEWRGVFDADRDRLPAQRIGIVAGGRTGEAQDRARIGARAALDGAGLSLAVDEHLRALAEQSWRGLHDVDGAVEAMGLADDAGGDALRGLPGRPRHWTMSTSTRRPSRTAAARTSWRTAFAVRPPRPITRP